MSKITDAQKVTRMKVGVFTALGIALIGVLTVYVNDKPFWWRPCSPVYINVADATGLKTKSPIRSLGLQIGYLKSVELSETHVRLMICITAPVEVLSTTHAYIRGEGFLGDKFVELRPVRYTGTTMKMVEDDGTPGDGASQPNAPAASPSPVSEVPLGEPVAQRVSKTVAQTATWMWDLIAAPVYAQEGHSAQNGTAPGRVTVRKKGADIPVGEKSGDVQAVVEQVNELVKEMTTFTQNLRQAIDPKELRDTMQQLNHTLTNASKVLAPEGGHNTTAQRTLAKLEDAIEQLRDQLTRINRGEGSVGMVLNDPTYADELKKALKGINKLLGRAGDIRFVIDLGGDKIRGYSDGRGFFRLGIWPSATRYYLIGITSDPRGKRTLTRTTTTSGGTSTTVESEQIEENGLVFTAMLGKQFFEHRLDTSVGVLHGDATGSVQLNLGPVEHEDFLNIRSDLYSHSGIGVDDRLTLMVKPHFLYVKGGLEGMRQVAGKTQYYIGAGIMFDDEDIKLLFAFK